MTKQEYLRLSSFMSSSRRAPRAIFNGRRHVKGRGKHVGVVLKHSRVKPQVGLETIFITRK